MLQKYLGLPSVSTAFRTVGDSFPTKHTDSSPCLPLSFTTEKSALGGLRQGGISS